MIINFYYLFFSAQALGTNSRPKSFHKQSRGKKKVEIAASKAPFPVASMGRVFFFLMRKLPLYHEKMGNETSELLFESREKLIGEVGRKREFRIGGTVLIMGINEKMKLNVNTVFIGRRGKKKEKKKRKLEFWFPRVSLTFFSGEVYGWNGSTRKWENTTLEGALAGCNGENRLVVTVSGRKRFRFV